MAGYVAFVFNCISFDYEKTLSYFILNNFQLNQDWYVCPNNASYHIGVEHKFWGATILCIGVFILTLYTVCLLAIGSSPQMKTPAYKIMMFLGICDVISVLIDSIANGIFAFYGVTYCNYPTLIYVLGAFSLSTWMGCCASSLVLAVIRVSDLNSTNMFKKSFDGGKINYVLLVCFAYVFYGTFFTKPVIYNTGYMTWVFDPNIGKSSSNYVNYIHISNNSMVAILSISFYGYLASIYLRGNSKANSSKKLSKMQIKILLQSFLFCFFHSVSALLYAYMQLFVGTNTLILIGHLTWICDSGSVCIVYLTLNRTIRQSVKRLICPGSQKVIQVSSLSNR